MGATSKILVATPAAQSRTTTLGRINSMRVPFTCTMSSSYSTGGDTLTMPTATKLDMWKIQGINVWDSLVAPSGGALSGVVLIFDWNGSVTAPKIQAFNIVTSAFSEVAAAVDLHTVTIVGELILAN